MTILWIGGATDAGKTTLARELAARFGCELYEYDRTDAIHHEALASEHPDIAAFLQASLDDRWVTPTPAELFERSMRSFRLRWPLLLRDLDERRASLQSLFIVEGFGLLPELVAPLMGDPRQGLWLTPTDAFRRGSWRRRGKPSFAKQLSDPQRGAANLLARDRLLAAEIERQAAALQRKLIRNDGGRTPEQLAQAAAEWFAPCLPA